MEVWQTLLLAIVQGIAEFLPISSSGHLTLLQALFTSADGHSSLPAETSLEMNVALHLGTLFSILLVYRHDLWQLRHDLPLMARIVVASIPVAVVGFLFKDNVEALFGSPLIVGCALVLTAGLLLLAQTAEGLRARTDESSSADSEVAGLCRTVTFPRAVLVGLFQALGVVPGVSRSGSTIAGGLIAGTSRDDAARFSFLIAIPAIGGVALIKSIEIVQNGGTQTSPGHLFLGLVVSFVVGVACLSWLLRLIAKNKLHWFAIYCGLLGGGVILWQLNS